MSRPALNRPKTAAGLPIKRISVDKDRQDSAENLPSASASTHRLPLLHCTAPHLSRQPRLWTPTLGPDGHRVVIGEGAFGCVFKATARGLPVAVKEVGSGSAARRRRRTGIGDNDLDHDYKREVRGAGFLLGLRHENVVRYLQFDTSVPGLLYVVMELIEGRNLAELRRAGPFAEGDMRSVMAQACRGLHYLHSHKPPIVHRDVKGSNIMLTNGDRVVKLVDLGLAILCDQCNKPANDDGESAGETRLSLAGTYRFMAPEVFDIRQYSPSSDVFALGCTAFELHCGHPPHADKSNPMAVCYAVMRQPMPDMHQACNPRLIDLYRSCTQKDPNLRPSAAEILRHSFIVGAP